MEKVYISRKKYEALVGELKHLKEIKLLKDKPNKTNFDLFLVDVVNNNAVNNISPFLRTHNKSNPYDLDIELDNQNSCSLCYSYCGFEVYIQIFESKKK